MLREVVSGVQKAAKYPLDRFGDAVVMLPEFPRLIERIPGTVSHPGITGLITGGVSEAAAITASLLIPGFDGSETAYGIFMGSLLSAAAGALTFNHLNFRNYARSNPLGLEGLDELIDRRMMEAAQYSKMKGYSSGGIFNSSYTHQAHHGRYLGRFLAALTVEKDKEKALGVLNEYVSEMPSVLSNILAASVLELVSMDAKKFWDAAIDEIKAGDYEILPVGEPGVHAAYRIGNYDFITGTFFFKESVFDEAANIRHVAELPKDSKYGVPRVIRDSTELLVLHNIEGQSPSELYAAGKLRDKHLEQVIDYLAWLHHNVRPSLSRRGAVDISAKTGNVLSNLELSDYEQAFLKRFFSDNMAVYGSQPVFAKDPHPAQWLFTKKQLIALDWEDKGVVPYFIDASKFYTHPDMPIAASKISQLHDEACRMYNDGKFRLNMIIGMLFQTLSFASAWKEMPHVAGRRAELLEQSMQTFELLRQDHATHFSAKRREYEQAESIYKQMHERLAA